MTTESKPGMHSSECRISNGSPPEMCRRNGLKGRVRSAACRSGSFMVAPFAYRLRTFALYHGGYLRRLENRPAGARIESEGATGQKGQGSACGELAELLGGDYDGIGHRCIAWTV